MKCYMKQDSQNSDTYLLNPEIAVIQYVDTNC